MGTPVAELCRMLGISEQSFYRWRKLYGGMEPSEARELRQLREENVRLKRLVADLSLDKVMLQDVVQKSGEARQTPRSGAVSGAQVSGQRAARMSVSAHVS
jgi:putative transposase